MHRFPSQFGRNVLQLHVWRAFVLQCEINFSPQQRVFQVVVTREAVCVVWLVLTLRTGRSRSAEDASSHLSVQRLAPENLSRSLRRWVSNSSANL